MATEYVIEIGSWDQSIDLMPSPGGIPEEHTFQGGLVFIRHLEIEGSVRSPVRHRGKRLRIWLSALWLPEVRTHSLNELGTIEERASTDGGGELLANLYAPEAALAPAAACLGSCWKYLRLTTAGRSRSRARVTQFSFSRTSEIRAA